MQEKYLLSITEASSLFGIGQHRLREIIREDYNYNYHLMIGRVIKIMEVFDMSNVTISRAMIGGKRRYVLYSEEKENVMQSGTLLIIVGRAKKEGYTITNLKEFLEKEKEEA